MKNLLTILLLLASTELAHAECKDNTTSCMLQEEGMMLLGAGKFTAAAEKFKASIAAGPSARAYLGYAQALELGGRIALGYENLLEAKKLNDKELEAAPADEEVLGRADRLKYKLAELQAKVATVSLALPDFVKVEDVVSVQRKDEGDLVDPLKGPLLIAANKQEMVAFLKDGRSILFTVSILPGATGSFVIPVPRPVTVVEKPTTIIQQIIAAPVDPPKVFGAIDLGMVAPNFNVTEGLGGLLRFEYRHVPQLRLTGRIGGYLHRTHTYDEVPVEFSAVEGDVLVGARWMLAPVFHVGAEVGLLVYSRRSQMIGAEQADVQTFAYPTLSVGAGVKLDRVDLQIGVMKHLELSDRHLEMPLRIMVTAGFEVLRL